MDSRATDEDGFFQGMFRERRDAGPACFFDYPRQTACGLNRGQRLRRASSKLLPPLGGWLYVEKHMFDVARFVEALQALGERFDLVF